MSKDEALAIPFIFSVPLEVIIAHVLIHLEKSDIIAFRYTCSFFLKNLESVAPSICLSFDQLARKKNALELTNVHGVFPSLIPRSYGIPKYPRHTPIFCVPRSVKIMDLSQFEQLPYIRDFPPFLSTLYLNHKHGDAGERFFLDLYQKFPALVIRFIKDKTIYTPFSVFSLHNYVALINHLFKNMPDDANAAMNEVTDGYTPLMIAAKNNFQSLATLLVQKKANLDIVNEHGCTALTYALDCSSNRILLLLIGNGANTLYHSPILPAPSIQSSE